MKSPWIFLCCLVLAVGLTSCTPSDPAPADDESTTEVADDGAEAEGEAEAETPAPVVSNATDGVPAPPDVAAPPEDAQTSESGLASKVVKEGKGKKHPGKSDIVTVHYTGWTPDGKMFDSSTARGEPIRLPLDGVMPGLSEGMQLMVPGETRRLWIPGPLALDGRPGTPQGMLVFDVELISFVQFPNTPEDVAEVPKNAKRTKSGLASRVLKKGTGKKHAGPTSTVTINFTGWTTDGQLVRSTFTQGKPAEFILEKTSIAGWKEGLPLMVVGETRRFWIPGDLALDGFSAANPNAPGGLPAGMLVFDVEMLDIQ